MEFGQQLFFYMPQSWDMGQIILLPLRRKACCGFFKQEKSNGFGRERTRESPDRPARSQSLYRLSYPANR
jgi:hypothetical protein